LEVKVKRLTLLEVLLVSVHEFESNQLEATSLEASDDVADESTLDTVGLEGHRSAAGSLDDAPNTYLDHDVCALLNASHGVGRDG
jgi:hypothetical protein